MVQDEQQINEQSIVDATLERFAEKSEAVHFALVAARAEARAFVWQAKAVNYKAQLDRIASAGSADPDPDPEPGAEGRLGDPAPGSDLVPAKTAKTAKTKGDPEA